MNNMSIPKIEERSLYSPIINYLKSLDFKATGEVKLAKKSPDILFYLNSISFVIEVKIGKPEIGLKAAAQAYDYANKLNTNNIIILIYPERYRDEVALDENIQKISLDVKINALILTEYWTDNLLIKPRTLFKVLKTRITREKRKIDFNTTVELIGNFVKDLNTIIYQEVTTKLFSEVVNKLDLFSSIGEFKDKKTAENQVINLASYLLFNQLLFYHIYIKKTEKQKQLPELTEISKIGEIQDYFDKILKIDYQSIYKVNILGHIPNKNYIIETLNEVIKSIKLLRAELITHDLAGRFFHDLIPTEVRKVLAAFYTHPMAADLLAGLTLESHDETVIDPACGSGTLLVAAYKRKLDLYKNLYGFSNLKAIHKNFIENDLSGIDIMPFAAHISAINLTMQNIEQETNKVRIATFDTLDIIEKLKQVNFGKKGVEISPYTTTLQLSIDGEFGRAKKFEKKGAISAKGEGSSYYLQPADVLLMNPPFSDRLKLPPDFREKLKKNPLGEICGHNINLWGYFLAISDFLLKKGGKIGAVIPINIARGGATEKIRNFYLNNYSIKYIVKSMKDVAFSEGANFRDILFIAEKKKPQTSDITKIIFLKKSTRDLKEGDIEYILESNKEYVDTKEITHEELIKFKDNFMPLLISKEVFIFHHLLKNTNKLKSLNPELIKIGLPYRPKGVSDGVFITNPIDKSRISQAKIVLSKKSDDSIQVKLKKISIEQFSHKFQIDSLKPALRTNTGIKNIVVAPDSYDYVLVKKDEVYWEKIKNLGVKLPKPFPWDKHLNQNLIEEETHLVIPRKIRLNSPNMYVISIYSDIDYKCVGPSLWYITALNKEEAKIQCLFFNSIINILQILLYKSESLGSGYFEIMKSDWNLFVILNIQNLSKENKEKLLNFFEKIRNIKFPSIIEQLDDRFHLRVELDILILEILGYSKTEINQILPKLYDTLSNELKSLKTLKSKL